jgi:hypothetical protein
MTVVVLSLLAVRVRYGIDRQSVRCLSYLCVCASEVACLTEVECNQDFICIPAPPCCLNLGTTLSSYEYYDE